MPNPNKLHNRSEITDNRHFESKKYPDPVKILALITSFRFQVIAMTIYLGFELLIIFKNGGKGSMTFFISYYALNLIFFYLNCLVILPLALKIYSSIYKPILLILSSMILQLFLIIIINGYFFPVSTSFYDDIAPLTFINNGWKVVQNFLLSLIVWGALTMIRLLLRQKMLENNYLYSRISPHLLFSCLNLIHSNIQAISAKGGEMVVRLSAFARSAMKDLAADGKSFLDDEIDMIRNLIEINRLRFDEDIYVHLDIGADIESNHFRLPPQLIFSLVDNVFKYGILDKPELPAWIRIHSKGQNLHVEITNGKTQEKTDFESHKIGLANVKRRLENTYGKKFMLAVEENDEHFKLNLSIPI